MRRFYLNRIVDQTGVSGTGRVTEGVVFSDGSVAMRWMTEFSSWCIYRSMEEVIKIHGHNGATVVEYVDQQEGLPDPVTTLERRGNEIWRRVA